MPTYDVSFHYVVEAADDEAAIEAAGDSNVLNETVVELLHDPDRDGDVPTEYARDLRDDWFPEVSVFIVYDLGKVPWEAVVVHVSASFEDEEIDTEVLALAGLRRGDDGIESADLAKSGPGPFLEINERSVVTLSWMWADDDRVVRGAP